MKILYITTEIFIALFFVDLLYNVAKVLIPYELPFPEYQFQKDSLKPYEVVITVITMTCLITIELRNARHKDKLNGE